MKLLRIFLCFVTLVTVAAAAAPICTLADDPPTRNDVDRSDAEANSRTSADSRTDASADRMRNDAWVDHRTDAAANGLRDDASAAGRADADADARNRGDASDRNASAETVVVAEAMADAELGLDALLYRVDDEQARQAVRQAIDAHRRARHRAVSALNDARETDLPDARAEARNDAAGDARADVAGHSVEADNAAATRLAVQADSEERDRQLKRAQKMADRQARRAFREARQQAREASRIALNTIDRIVIDRPVRVDVSARAATDARIDLDRR